MFLLAVPFLLRRRGDSSAAASARARCAARAGAAESGTTAGRGWFDSSYELQSGLTVVEHAHLHGDTLELAVSLLMQPDAPSRRAHCVMPGSRRHHRGHGRRLEAAGR